MSETSLQSTVTTRFSLPVVLSILGLLFLLRIGLALIFPLPVSGDEAYYWDWSRQLAWGYYSKPPFIAWAMGFADWTIGGELGIRVHAAIYATVGLAAWAWLAREMFDLRTAGWTVLLLALSPASVALGLLLTIDAPLFAFSAVAIAAAWRISQMDSGRRTLSLLMLYGTALALGHLTKQIAWILPVLIPGALATVDGATRRRLRGVIGVGAVSYLALVPTFLWNAANGWPLAGHTLSHLSSGGVSLSRQAARFAEFLGSQFGLISPITFVLVGIACVLVLRHPLKLKPSARYLAVLSIPGLLVFLGLALRQRVNPNWPLLFYPAAILLAVELSLHREALRKWIPRAAVAGGVFAGATAFAAPLLSVLGLEYSKLDPLKRLRGWPDYARAVTSFNQNLPQGPLPIIVDGHRYYVAQLAFYGADNPTPHRWEIPEKIHSQYEVWGPSQASIEGPSLLVTLHPDGTCREKVANAFRSIEPIGTHRFPPGTAPIEGLSFFRVAGWQNPPGPAGKPPPEPPTEP